MNRNEAETQLLDEALARAQELAGIEIKVLERELRHEDFRVDVVLKIGGRRVYAEIKAWAQQANRPALLHQLHRLPKPAMLVADYVNPNMATELREAGIQFMDTVGNVYLEIGNRLVYVVGQKAPARKKTGTRRAFNNTGLKIIFALLRDEKLLHANYREIAFAAGVALGAVGAVLQDLKETGFLTQQGKNGALELKRTEELFRKWVENYLERLQPKQLIGRYVAQDPLWWQRLDIRDLGGVWGGEVAANKMMRRMRPKVATVYLPRVRLVELIQKARLRKFDGGKNEEPEGLVEIYEPFWEMDNKEELAHPVIVYADLQGMRDPRANEVAEVLYEQYIAEYLR